MRLDVSCRLQNSSNCRQNCFILSKPTDPIGVIARRIRSVVVTTRRTCLYQPPDYQPQFSLWVRQLLTVILLVGGVFSADTARARAADADHRFLVTFVMFFRAARWRGARRSLTRSPCSSCLHLPDRYGRAWGCWCSRQHWSPGSTV